MPCSLVHGENQDSLAIQSNQVDHWCRQGRVCEDVRPGRIAKNLEIILRVCDAGYLAVVLDTNDQHAASGIGKGHEGFADVLRYESYLPTALIPRRAVKRALEFPEVALALSKFVPKALLDYQYLGIGAHWLLAIWAGLSPL